MDTEQRSRVVSVIQCTNYEGRLTGTFAFTDDGRVFEASSSIIQFATWNECSRIPLDDHREDLIQYSKDLLRRITDMYDSPHPRDAADAEVSVREMDDLIQEVQRFLAS